MTEPDKIHILRDGSNFSLCGRYFPYFQTEALNTVDCFCCQDTLKFIELWGGEYRGYAVRRIPSKVEKESIDLDPYSRSFLANHVGGDFLFEGIVSKKYHRKPEQDGSPSPKMLLLHNVTVGNTIITDHTHVTAPSYWWYITDIGYRIRFRAIVSEYKGYRGVPKYGLTVYDGDPFYVLTTNATKLKGVGYYAVRSMGR